MRKMSLSANTFYRRVREYETHNGIVEPTSCPLANGKTPQSRPHPSDGKLTNKKHTLLETL